MVNYKDGKIYKIVCGTTGNVYYGSTTTKLNLRLNSHRNRTEYSSSAVLENNNYKIELVEDYPCENRKELLERERYYIENNDCVNLRLPTKTEEEINDRKHKYYKDNVLKWRTYNSKKKTCDCGAVILTGNMAKHKLTQRHRDNLTNRHAP